MSFRDVTGTTSLQVTNLGGWPSFYVVEERDNDVQDKSQAASGCSHGSRGGGLLM